ncbi:MAG: porin, partial [Porticoccus sp.]|nr:porin [Porticoccus sp.]
MSATNEEELPEIKQVEEGLTGAEQAEKDAKEDVEEQEENLRDSIIENIDVSGEDNELTRPTEPSEPLEVTPESTPTPESTTKTEEEDKIWFDRFRIIPRTMSTLPEYVPGLAGNNWIFFGRAEGEYAHFSSGRLSDDSGYNFRSLRAGLVKVFYKRATVKMEVDFTDSDSNWTDLYVRFNTELGLVTVGNQKISQALVAQTSRLARTFMEEALPADAFSLGRRLGVGWDLHKKNFGAHLTAFGGDINEDTGDSGYGGRFYFNPAKTRFSLFHVGVSVVQENIDGDARSRAYPESRVADTRLIDTQDIKSVDKQKVGGLELAAAKDSYSL